MESQGLPKCPCFEGTWKGQQKATNSVWKVSQMYAYINMCVHTYIYILFYYMYLFIHLFPVRMVLNNSKIQTNLIIYIYMNLDVYIYMYVCVHISCVCMHACMSAHASWGWRCLDLGPESHDPWSHAFLLLCGIEKPWQKIYVAKKKIGVWPLIFKWHQIGNMGTILSILEDVVEVRFICTSPYHLLPLHASWRWCVELEAHLQRIAVQIGGSYQWPRPCWRCYLQLFPQPQEELNQTTQYNFVEVQLALHVLTRVYIYIVYIYIYTYVCVCYIHVPIIDVFLFFFWDCILSDMRIIWTNDFTPKV